MLLRTYIDDSADETQERAVVAGAYVGFYPQWNKLQQRWKKCLKKEGIRYFHTTECYNLRGEFARFRNSLQYPKPRGREAAQALLDDLETIIHDSQIMGLAVCIDMDAYNTVRNTEERAAEIFPPDAFEICLQSLIKMCVEIVRDEFSGNRQVGFVCDDSDNAYRIERVYRAFKRINPGLAQFMGKLAHQDDKRFPQLQAADLMAHLAKRRFVDWLDDPQKAVFTAEPALKTRLKRLSVHKIGVWDRKYMLEVLNLERQQRGFTSVATPNGT